jgi:hypothetical protein
MKYERIPNATADLASADAMAKEAITVAERLMWAIYGSDETARAGAVAGVLHAERFDPPAAES